VLLTSKKPESSESAQSSDRRAPVIGSVPGNTRARLGRKGRSRAGQSVSSSSPILGDDEDDLELGDEENDALRPHRDEEEHQVWQVGEEDEESETGNDNRDEQTTHGESRHTASSTGGPDSKALYIQ